MKLMGLLFIVIVGLTVLTVAPPADAGDPVTWYFCIDNGSWADAASWSDSIDGNGDCNGNTGVPTVNDHVIILSGLTCQVDDLGEGCSDITVEADAVVNVTSNDSFQIRGTDDVTSTITGTIYLLGDESKIRVNNGPHTFVGSGKIVGQHSGAQITLGGNVTLTNQITIEGILTIKDGLDPFNATFANEGTVNANASGTLAIMTNELEDGESAGLWQVSASGAVLKFDIEETAAAERAVLAVERIKADIGIPAKLSDVGVTGEDLSAMAEKTYSVKRILRVNPRQVTLEDVTSILESAL